MRLGKPWQARRLFRRISQEAEGSACESSPAVDDGILPRHGHSFACLQIFNSARDFLISSLLNRCIVDTNAIKVGKWSALVGRQGPVPVCRRSEVSGLIVFNSNNASRLLHWRSSALILNREVESLPGPSYNKEYLFGTI